MVVLSILYMLLGYNVLLVEELDIMEKIFSLNFYEIVMVSYYITIVFKTVIRATLVK